MIFVNRDTNDWGEGQPCSDNHILLFVHASSNNGFRWQVVIIRITWHVRTFDQQVIVVGVAREDELELAGWWTAANSNPIHCSHHSQTACPVWLAEVWVTHPSYEHIWLSSFILYCPLCFVPWNLKEKKSFFSQREFVAFQNRRCIFCLACWSLLGFLKWKTLGWLFAEREDKLRRAEVTYSNERWYNYFVTDEWKVKCGKVEEYKACCLILVRTWSLRRKVWWRLFFHFFVR